MKQILFAAFSWMTLLSGTCFADLDSLISRIKAHERDLHRGAVVVTQGNKILYQSVFGHLKGDTGAITPQTLFPLASSSKPITGMMVAYLAKQNRVGWEDPLSHSLKGVDPRIQLHHLLSHSSGFRDTFGNKEVEAGKPREQLEHLFDPESATHSMYPHNIEKHDYEDIFHAVFGAQFVRMDTVYKRASMQVPAASCKKLREGCEEKLLLQIL